MTYKHIVAGALVLGATTLLVSGPVSAHGPGFGMNHDTLVQRLASAFGKSTDEVQTVFDQLHEEHQAEMQQQLQTKLDELVANGSLTAEQKQLVLDKQKENQTEREAMKDQWQTMTPEERKAQMEKQREEMKTWAQENGIDLSLVFMGGRRGPGPRTDTSPTPQAQDTQNPSLLDQVTNLFK
ncbi:hypothetical protein KC726_03625 [Candidatus Woesebacteria bacterium]|nr:hypothetical protein [Candidatus Woesebacteria bacterium]